MCKNKIHEYFCGYSFYKKVNDMYFCCHLLYYSQFIYRGQKCGDNRFLYGGSGSITYTYPDPTTLKKRKRTGSNSKNHRTFYKIRIQIRPKHMGPDPNPLCQELIPRVRNRVKLKNRIILSQQRFNLILIQCLLSFNRRDKKSRLQFLY